ncbi:AlbA family DNA-binding domain-containing protein [Nocardia goodfellowii]
MNIGNPLWIPRTEDELRQAAIDGLLEESHILDIKRELPSGESANKGTAKDIAAFALDGGVIIFGVDEGDGTTPPQLHPIDLAGLPERIDNIATSRVREAVLIQTHVIEANHNAGKGYLVVHVPKSPRAPHMADGRYYGRADKTNRILDDAEVSRLHEQRTAAQRDILPELNQRLDRLGAHAPMLGILAQPIGAGEELLLPLAEATDWKQTIHRIVKDAKATDNCNTNRFLGDGPDYPRRPHAVGITVGMDQGRWPNKQQAVELDFAENGALFLASERAIVDFADPGNPRSTRPAVFETEVVEQTDLIVRVAAAIARNYGFTGAWRFGLVLTGIGNAIPFPRGGTVSSYYSQPYPDQNYTKTAEATFVDLNENPRGTVKTLVGPLLRTLSVDASWLAYLNKTPTR